MLRSLVGSEMCIRDRTRRARLVRYRNRPVGIRWRLGSKSGEVSSGTFDRDEAVGARALLLRDLANGILPSKETEGPAISWADFRLRYEVEHLADMSRGSQAGWRTAANHLERLQEPRRLADVGKGMLSKFRGDLVSEGKSPFSVATYLRTIRAALGLSLIHI